MTEAAAHDPQLLIRLGQIDDLITEADGDGRITSGDAPHQPRALAAIHAARIARAEINALLAEVAALRTTTDPAPRPVPGADGVFARPTRYRVAALPPHHTAERYVGLDLVQAGPDEWRVEQGTQWLRPADGASSTYDVPGAGVDPGEWRASFTVPFDQALAAAARFAPTVVTSNQRAADYLHADETH